MLHNYIKKVITFVLIIIISTSCAVLQDYNIMNKNNIIEKIRLIDSEFNSYESLIFVDIASQQLFHIKKGTVIKVYSISSSFYGTGSEANSFKTPLGKHEIYKKIGKDLPENAILKGRVWNGAIASIVSEPIDTDFDHVTSRILWLDGLEKGRNRGGSVDSKSRYIYIHGTAEEGLIGQPASLGCIRMLNDDVIEIFNKVRVGTQVLIFSNKELYKTL